MPVATSTLPPPEQTSVEIAMEPEVSRCLSAPQTIVSKLGFGLTVEGFNTHVKGVQMVESNDDRPWIFIGGEIVAPGMKGVRPRVGHSLYRYRRERRFSCRQHDGRRVLRLE